MLRALRQQPLMTQSSIIKVSKTLLIKTLNKLDLEYVPSDTNFVLYRIGSPLADYTKHMQDNGIRVVRKMTKDDHWNRLSLGTQDEMAMFCITLLEFRERAWCRR